MESSDPSREQRSPKRWRSSRDLFDGIRYDPVMSTEIISAIRKCGASDQGGLAFVPDVIRSLPPEVQPSARLDLVKLSRAGIVELRPDSNPDLLLVSDRVFCPLRQDGVPLSYVQVATEKKNPAVRDHVTIFEAKEAGQRIGIDWRSAPFDVEDLRAGIMHEREHADVTHGDMDATARIAWAHLKKDPGAYSPKPTAVTIEAVKVQCVTVAEQQNPTPEHKMQTALQYFKDAYARGETEPSIRIIPDLGRDGMFVFEATYPDGKYGKSHLLLDPSMKGRTAASTVMYRAKDRARKWWWKKQEGTKKNPSCPTGACPVEPTVTVRSVLATVPGLKPDEQAYAAHLVEWQIQSDQSFDRAVMLRSLANAIDAEDAGVAPKVGMNAAMKRAVLTLDTLEKAGAIFPYGATGLWKAQCPCKAKKNPTEPIAAYMDRESSDPMTGATGTLRDEWRVRLVSDFNPEALSAAWGSGWRRSAPEASHVLEHRYVRRGVEEPWTPFQSANSSLQALQYIDDKATAVDAELKDLQAKRRAHQEKQRAEAEEKRQKVREQEEREQHQEKAQAAFIKLAKSKDAALTDRWNAFMSAHNSPSEQHAFLDDPTFMKFYKAASEAETVPAKRRSIKEFLAYAEKKNPTRTAPQQSTTVQTLLFDKNRWTSEKAKEWAKGHGFKYGKVDTKGPTVLRLRQIPPDKFREFAGTIPFGQGTGIQAVVGFLK